MDVNVNGMDNILDGLTRIFSIYLPPSLPLAAPTSLE